MLKLKDGLILYHGSYCEVKEPDLAKCAKRKDFGQGFYLTTSKEQAASFLKTSIAKAIAAGKIEENQNFGYISTYEIKFLKELHIHVFEEADVNWLHCIAAHRKKKLFAEVEHEMAMYDVIIGKIAEETGKENKDVLADFLCSKTGKALYDKETRLWCNGPSYIADLYMEEISNK